MDIPRVVCLLGTVSVLASFAHTADAHHSPIVGVLTQVLRDYKRFTSERHLHIAASYVKWIESSGAQVLPILLNQNDSYYERVFQQTDGLLLPGGDNLLDPQKRTPMMVAARRLYDLAIHSNNAGNYYPIWGTCLGMQLLSVLSSNKNALEHCIATDVTLPVQFVERGRLFKPAHYAGSIGQGDFSKDVMGALNEKNLTYNYHHNCVTDSGLALANLTDFYRPLAYSQDLKGSRFIAIFEAINYPFYGVQFHPEKAPYEFTIRRDQKNVGHSREAVAASRFFGDYFVGVAGISERRSGKASVSPQDLIYAFSPMYTGLMNDMYEQRYLFPFNHDAKTSDEEFLDRMPTDDDVIPEFRTQSVNADGFCSK